MADLYEVGDKLVVREEVLSNTSERVKLFYTGKQLTVVGKWDSWVYFNPSINGSPSSTHIKNVRPA